MTRYDEIRKASQSNVISSYIRTACSNIFFSSFCLYCLLSFVLLLGCCSASNRSKAGAFAVSFRVHDRK